MHLAMDSRASPAWGPEPGPESGCPVSRNARVGSPQSDRVLVGGKLQCRNGIQNFRSCCLGYFAGAIDDARDCGRRNPRKTGNIPDRERPVLHSSRRVGHRYPRNSTDRRSFPDSGVVHCMKTFPTGAPLFEVANQPANGWECKRGLTCIPDFNGRKGAPFSRQKNRLDGADQRP